MKRIVLVGATSTIASECARIWNQENGTHFILIARDKEKTKRLAKDLKVRNPENTSDVEIIDFSSSKEILAAINNAAKEKIDYVLIAQGVLPNQFEIQNDIKKIKQAIAINSTSVVQFAQGFANEMQHTGGTIAVIGSVAGDRGRKANYVYGSTKSLVATFTRGLAHRFADTSLKIVLIKPGPTATAMTAERTQSGQKQADVKVVAAQIVRGIKAGKTEIYTPGIWRLIMLIIRHIPNVIFNRMNF